MANSNPRDLTRRRLRIGQVILLIGVVGAAFVLREGVQALESSQWPTTTATILRSELVKELTRRGLQTWTVAVEYRYTVQGRDYTGDRIRLGGFDSTSERSLAESRSEHYAEGSQHPLAYDPADPFRAVLEPGLGAASVGLGLGAVLDGLVLALGITVVVQSRRKLAAARGTLS